VARGGGQLEARTRELPVRAVVGTEARDGVDRLAVEEPLQILVRAGAAADHPLAVTMRTPGDDAALAAGFLFSEGLIGGRGDVAAIETPAPDTVVVALAPGVALPADRRERGFTVTSACGVCGSADRAVLQVRPRFALQAGPALGARVAATLPDRLRAAQPAFAATGGLHAAGLFAPDGALLLAAEDVGRHNAVDKLVGARLLADALPARGAVLVVSGRASFELVQKAVMAGIAVLAAVGAPSTAAVALAREHGLTLIGFLREGRFNIYAGRERVVASDER
jgi:FdhD protein